jgi:hypothetical protein
MAKIDICQSSVFSNNKEGGPCAGGPLGIAMILGDCYDILLSAWGGR